MKLKKQVPVDEWGRVCRDTNSAYGILLLCSQLQHAITEDTNLRETKQLPAMTPQWKCVRQERGDPRGGSGTRAGSVPCTLSSAKLEEFGSFSLFSSTSSVSFLGLRLSHARRERKTKQECTLIIQMPNSQRKDS